MNLISFQQYLSALQSALDDPMILRSKAIAAFQSYLSGTGIYTSNIELKVACASFSEAIDLINAF